MVTAAPLQIREEAPGDGGGLRDTVDTSEVDNMRVCNKYYLILLFDTNNFFHIYERRPCKSNGEQNDLSYVRSTRTKILT